MNLGQLCTLEADMPSTASGYMALVQQAAKGIQEYTGVDVSGIGDAVTNAALTEAAQWATNKPFVQVNRARSAALLDWFYAKLDLFAYLQPIVFAAAGGVCLISSAMIWRRRKIPESWALYSILALGSGAVAWFTRPYSMRPAPAPDVETPGKQKTPSEGAFAQVMGWLDRKVAENTTQAPGWEAATYGRLVRDLGYSTMNPAVRVLLTRNSM